MKKSLIALLIAIVMVFSACNTTVNSDNKDGKTEEKVETKPEEKKEEKSELSEEEAWKQEPFYGKTVKIGYNGGLCTGGPGLAHALGYFDELGIKTEIVNVQSKVDAIGTNQVQLTTDHIATLLVPAVNGIDMVFKSGAQTGCKSLFVLNDDKINKTSDLIGKKVGVPDGIGNSDHNIALRFFNHDDVDPKEIKFVPVEGSASILALQNHEIEAVVLSDQFAEKFINDGTIKMIRSLTYDEDFSKEPCCVYAFNKTFVKENPITAKKMTQALFKISDYIANNIEDATQALFDNNWASGDFDQAVRMMDSYNWQVTNEMADSALTSILDDYKEFGVITTNKDTATLLDEVWMPEDFKNENVVKTVDMTK
ncbi:MAG: ABC transporter substrate-binding protein [Firmicutes bacterium]|nr:ABC transporter substrate-binding protein [Bacillota bacterium]